MNANINSNMRMSSQEFNEYLRGLIYDIKRIKVEEKQGNQQNQEKQEGQENYENCRDQESQGNYGGQRETCNDKVISQAYEKIFEAVKPFVYKHGREILSKYNLSSPWGNRLNGLDVKNEWQEHMQNLYIEIYNCVNRFDPDKNTKFTYYAIVCIRNYFFNYAQKQIRIHIKEKSINSTINSANLVNPNRNNSNNSNEKMDKLLIDTFASNEEGPEEKCLNAERNEALACALKKLKDKQKRFIYYYYSERMPMTEIAELFGEPYYVVRYLRDKVLEELRRGMGKQL